MRRGALAVWGLTAAFAAALGAGACSSTTACAATSSGFYVCDTYAGAYPYDYAYVDPLYAGAGGYYPYAVDTYYDPYGYATVVYARSTAPVPIADPVVGSNVPELLDGAHRAANAINAGVRAALDPIRALIETPPTQNGDDSVVYGPSDLGDGSYRFTMNRLSPAGERFGWQLEARPAGGGGSVESTDGFARVAGGVIRVGNTARRGRGGIGVDCDALSAADPSVTCRGTLLTGFAHTDAGDKVLNVRLRAYTPDPSAVMPLDASAFAWRQGDTANQVRLVAAANLSGTATPTPETVAIKLTWLKDVGVRAAGAATGGDIPPGGVELVSTCVGPDLERPTRDCPTELVEQTPNPDATAVDPPVGMPEMPEAPATMPDGSGN